MSQEDVRSLLAELDGEATVHEIANLARKKFPDRTLDTYLSERLQPMKKKGIVEQIDGKWRLTEKGWEIKIEHTIDELDVGISEADLKDYNLEVVNLVGSLRLNRRLDLETLSEDLQNTEYHPETYPSMIYRPSEERSLSVLTPSSGKLAIVGATTKEELIWGTQDFLDQLEELGIETDKTTDDLLVQNIVVNFDLNRELDLSTVSIALGLENIEYEPEQFPGLIYRGSGNSTVLIFGSGKSVITGAKTYLGAVEARDDIIEILADIGVELNVETVLDDSVVD